MLGYNGIKCPVCDIPFKSDDDIVVCPDCGAPYHRECYAKKGECIFENIHKEGGEWKAPEPPVPPDTSAEIKDRECPVCGTLNAHSSLFCNRCGSSLSGAPQQYSNSPTPQSTPIETSSVQQRTAFGGAMPQFVLDPMGGVSPAEEIADGVTFGDVSKLVKQNTGYYMSIFKSIKQINKSRFNFGAFLFSGAWLLYRKQNKSGAIVTALFFTLLISYYLVSIFVAMPIYYDYLSQIDVETTSAILLTSEQTQKLSILFFQNPMDFFLFALPTILLALAIILMIVVGAKANRMYMKHCIKTAKNIKLSSSGKNIEQIINEKGGVNTVVTIAYFICYLVVTYIPTLLRLFTS